MEVDINMWGVLLAAIAAMVVGSIWYAKPVFGKVWMKLAKLDMDRAKEESPKAMVGMFVMSLIMAYVLAYVAFIFQYFFDYSLMMAAFKVAVYLWIGFVLPVIVSSGLFEQRRKKLLAINAGNWLATLLAMGFVLGLVGL